MAGHFLANTPIIHFKGKLVNYLCPSPIPGGNQNPPDCNGTSSACDGSNIETEVGCEYPYISGTDKYTYGVIFSYTYGCPISAAPTPVLCYTGCNPNLDTYGLCVYILDYLGGICLSGWKHYEWEC